MRSVTLDAGTPAIRYRLRESVRRHSAVQSALLVVSFVTLVWAWSFPFSVLLDTRWIDVTALEPTLLVGGFLLIAGQAWKLVRRGDRAWLLLLAGYLGWLVVAALAHSSGLDLKRAVSYLLFSGLSIAVAFASVRLGSDRAARWVIAFFTVALVVAFTGALLERVTYRPGAVDPLAPLWSFFRPQQALFVENVGVMRHAPLHYPLDEEGLLRTSGIFGHPLYLGFFALLAAAVMTAVVIRAWREGARKRAAAYLVALCVAILVEYWTYSRSPFLGLIAVVVAAVVLELAVRVRQLRSGPDRRALLPGALVLSTLFLVLATTFRVDDLGLRRLGGIPFLGGDIAEDDSVEASAARAARLRLALQGVAVEMATESPRTLLLGTGMTAYETALKDLPPELGATRFTHPHSAWLTALLAGGIPAALLFASLLAAVWLRVVRALLASPTGATAVVLLALGAWIPVWSLVQFFGLNPLSASEAVILGTMLGFAGGFALPRERVDAGSG